MSEIWKVVEEAPTYRISNHGRVQNTVSDAYLNPVISQGKPNIKLRHEGRYQNYVLHRLIAAYFLPDFNPNFMVAFQDGDPSNCAADNLKMTTYPVRGRRK